MFPPSLQSPKGPFFSILMYASTCIALITRGVGWKMCPQSLQQDDALDNGFYLWGQTENARRVFICGDWHSKG